MIHKKKKQQSYSLYLYKPIYDPDVAISRRNYVKCTTESCGKDEQMNMNREGLQQNKTETEQLNRKAGNKNYNFPNNYYNELNSKVETAEGSANLKRGKKTII